MSHCITYDCMAKYIGLNVFTLKGFETKHLFLDAAKCKTINNTG